MTKVKLTITESKCRCGYFKKGQEFMTADNPDAVYACVNFGEAVCPEDIREQSICIDGDIGQVIEELRK